MKKYVFVVVSIVCVMSFVCLSAAQRVPGTMSDKALAGSIGPGTVIQVPSSDVSYAPTAAQIAAHEQLLAAKSMHLAPSLGVHTTAADVAVSGGRPTDVPLQQVSPAPEAPGDFTIFKKAKVSSICSGCAESVVNEPSAANSGARVVETSNWNIAYSTGGGGAWLNQNPYAISSGFCCDTQVVYDKDRDIFILLLLDYNGEGASTNGFTVSIARGLFPSTGPAWCTYKFNGSNFGEGATDTLDFPKIGLSNTNLFVTWNDYPPNSSFSASGLARFPLDALASCAGFNYNYLLRNTEFTFALAHQPSVHDVFYWVSNWFSNAVNGQNLRIFHWADGSNTYFFNTVAINAYTFGTVACGSPNWCSRLDPRYESVMITPAEYRAQANSAFAGDQILEVATTAGPSSFSGGNNYVVYNYFKLNSLAYIGNDQTYNTTSSFAYPGCAVNARGYVGCALSQGKNSPGGIVILQDNVSPTQPWGFNFVVGGINGATAWGDYNVTNPWDPGSGPFQTVLWNVSSVGAVQPYYIVFGRGSDANDYARWKAK